MSAWKMLRRNRLLLSRLWFATTVFVTAPGSIAANELRYDALLTGSNWELLEAEFLNRQQLDQLNARRGVRISLLISNSVQEEAAVIGISFEGACNGHGVRRSFHLSSGVIGAPVAPGVVTQQYCDDWRAEFDSVWWGRIISSSRVELESGKVKLHTRDGVLTFVRVE